MASRWKIVAAHGGDDDMSGANDSVIDVDGEEIVSWSMATNDIDEFGVTSTNGKPLCPCFVCPIHH